MPAEGLSIAMVNVPKMSIPKFGAVLRLSMVSQQDNLLQYLVPSAHMTLLSANSCRIEVVRDSFETVQRLNCSVCWFSSGLLITQSENLRHRDRPGNLTQVAVTKRN